MSIASLHTVPEDLKTSIVRIYSYEDKNIQGVINNPFYGEGLVFKNLTQFLLIMEQIMDDLKFPQAAVQPHRFKAGKKPPEPIIQEPLTSQAVLATFKVKVLFRQSASWQGTLSWVEGRQESSFRSALELIRLMDSALPQPAVSSQAANLHEAISAG